MSRCPVSPRPVSRVYRLAGKGQSEEDIAAAFFVSVNVVKQRLKLAAVSPELGSLLVLGASSVLRCVRGNDKGLKWLSALLMRRLYKVVAVALANKTARIIWAMLTKGGTYRGMAMGNGVESA